MMKASKIAMTPGSTDRDLTQVTSIKRLVWVATTAVVLFLGGFSAWAFGVPLSGAIIAPGIVVTDGNIQIVRHERGGVLTSLRIREGATVRKGEVMATLSRADDKAAEDELKIRIAGLVIKQMRLTAEQAQADRLTITTEDLPEVIRDVDPSRRDNLIADQMEEFRLRRTQLSNALDVLAAQKRALEEQLTGTQGELVFLQDQLKSVEKDVELRRQAVANGLSRESALREMERQASGLQGAAAKATAGIASLGQQIAEADNRIDAQRFEFLEKVNDELSRLRAEKLGALASLTGKSDAVFRVEIRAPVDGVVNKLHVNTIGSAVEPFAPIFEVVSDDQPLLIEARITTADIDEVYPQQAAHVVLSAFNRRVVDPVSAKVEFVGADARQDEARGEAYYIIRLAVDENDRAKLPQIVPGMPAEAYLVTHERTFADYIAEPFIESFQRAFRQ